MTVGPLVNMPLSICYQISLMSDFVVFSPILLFPGFMVKWSVTSGFIHDLYNIVSHVCFLLVFKPGLFLT